MGNFPSAGKNAKLIYWVAIVLSALIYALSFPHLMESVGPVGGSIVALPVVLAGLFFGGRAGLLAALAGDILNTALFASASGVPWLGVLAAYWPGHIMVFVIGYVSGLLHRGQAEDVGIRDELRFHDRYLALVSLATKNILDPRKSDQVYYYLVNHLANLMVADSAYLVRSDLVEGQFLLIASTLSDTQPSSELLTDPREVQALHSVVETGRSLVVEVSGSEGDAQPKIMMDPVRSVLFIPLRAGEYKFGAAVIGFDTLRRFTEQDIRYAEMAGTQIGLAFWAVQQELRIQKRLRDVKALGDIERVLSETERVGIDTVLQLIVNYARELMPNADQVVLHLLDMERQVLVPRAVSGFTADSKTNLHMHLGEGVAGQVIGSGQVVAISDARADQRFQGQAEPVNFRSLAVAPIQSNERRVGTISVQSPRPNAFTGDEIVLLGALGTQAAVAIENAGLLETTQKSLKEINALYHASQSLASSLDPDQLMKDVADQLQKSFGYYHVQVFLLDSETGDLVARQGSGEIGATYGAQGFRLQAGSGVAGHVAATGQPFVTNAVEETVFFERYPLLPNTQSELTVPIKVGNKVVGVLDIQQVPPAHLTERDLQLMSAVADQLAVSLQKANLYAELQASLNQEKATRSQLIQSERLAVVGRLLASVSHELNNPLQAIQNALFLLKDEEKLSEQGRQDLEIVLSETERMTLLIDRLRATYRPTRAAEFQPVQLNTIVHDVYALLATHLRHNAIKCDFLSDADLAPVPGIRDQLRQVVLNLCMNAVEAMPGGGHMEIRTRNMPDGSGIQLTIADTGRGIGLEILPHVFEPFVTSKDAGTGLGLTITYDIVRQHFGTIRAENRAAGGALFTVWLPLERKG